MTRSHSVRNIVLIGIGLVGLAMIVPSDQQELVAASDVNRPMVLSTSPELSSYLEARLRSAPAQKAVTLRTATPNETTASELPVQNPAVAPLPAPAAVVARFDNHSSAALNVRTGPAKSFASLFVLRPGTPLRIEQTKGNWAQIVTESGVTGWAYAPLLAKSQSQVAMGELVSTGTDRPPSELQASDATGAVVAPAIERPIVAGPEKSAAVVGENFEGKQSTKKTKAFRLANQTVLRTSPSRSASKVSVIDGGAKLLVAEWDGDWARVILSDGSSGWINVR